MLIAEAENKGIDEDTLKPYRMFAISKHLYEMLWTLAQ